MRIWRFPCRFRISFYLSWFILCLVAIFGATLSVSAHPNLRFRAYKRFPLICVQGRTSFSVFAALISFTFWTLSQLFLAPSSPIDLGFLDFRFLLQCYLALESSLYVFSAFFPGKSPSLWQRRCAFHCALMYLDFLGLHCRFTKHLLPPCFPLRLGYTELRCMQ